MAEMAAAAAMKETVLISGMLMVKGVGRQCSRSVPQFYTDPVKRPAEHLIEAWEHLLPHEERFWRY
jgi:hypothetical protein